LVELKLIEQPTAERYVAGTLSDDEVARFEEMMIDRPELAADVNVRRRIKAGLELLEQRSELAPMLTAEVRRPQYFQYAAAATLLVVVAGLWSTWHGEPKTMQALFTPGEVNVRPVAATFTLANRRSNEIPAFDVQRDGGLVRFRILVDDAASASYAVRMVAAEVQPGAIPLNTATVAPGSDGFAEIYLDPHELQSGSYRLSLKSPSGTEQVFPFTLRVVP
jgi:anti-sigma-K factor RskA